MVQSKVVGEAVITGGTLSILYTWLKVLIFQTASFEQRYKVFAPYGGPTKIEVPLTKGVPVHTLQSGTLFQAYLDTAIQDQAPSETLSVRLNGPLHAEL